MRVCVCIYIYMRVCVCVCVYNAYASHIISNIFLLPVFDFNLPKGLSRLYGRTYLSTCFPDKQ